MIQTAPKTFFVYDMQTAETQRVSISSDGAQAKSASDKPSISADGRFIAFESSAINLIIGDTVGGIFVHEIDMPVTGVTLDKTYIDLIKGSSETLVATVDPSGATNKAVTWSSSNDSIATVDSNGKVTGLASGSCMITVTTVDRSLTANCQVNVIIPVTDVTLNKTTLALKKGATETLVATVSPVDATEKKCILVLKQYFCCCNRC